MLLLALAAPLEGLQEKEELLPDIFFLRRMRLSMSV